MRYAYLLYSILLTTILFAGIKVWSMTTLAIAGLGVIIVLCAIGVFFGKPWSRLCACVSLLPVLALLGFHTVGRVIFVFNNRGFERADGQGSPLAFLIGFAMEQLVFLPTIAFFIWLWIRRNISENTPNKGLHTTAH